MIALDFANPLHTFDSTHRTYTATQDCYICGTLRATSNIAAGNGVFVDSTAIITLENFNGTMFIPPLKISNGSSIEIVGDIINTPNWSMLRVYKEV